MVLQVTDAEIKRARLPHAILLFDFIVIHIFLFILAISFIKSSYIPLIAIPVSSITLLSFVLFKSLRARTLEPSWFVRTHLLLAAKRARLFLILFLVTGTFTAIMVFGGTQFGLSKITSYSLAFGIGQLPFMVAMLALIVMEYDAEHQSKTGRVPSKAPTPSPVSGDK
jgi:hypothetical protein